jgi:glycosyltransferase involved in cell wall biosynthesis
LPNILPGHHKKTIKQSVKWWWSTRVLGLFNIRLKRLFQSGADAHRTVFEFEKMAPPLSKRDDDGITVILTAYRRVEYLAEQIKAIRAQTRAPLEIWVWTNASPDQLVDISSLADRVVVSNTNWLFWGRFALGNLARTAYVAFFDDDTLPQPRWFENCLNTISSGNDGILGGSGVLLPIEGGYSSKSKVGWNGRHLDEVAEVDLVGHAWFMRKEYLQFMWREEPHSWDNGEDIHLSYMALKHGGIKTYVPAHPENDSSLWSCRPDFGKVVGRQKVATFKTKQHRSVRSDITDHYRKDGWLIVEQIHGTTTKTFGGDLAVFNQKLRLGENFSLVRFGDGEMRVINGDNIDLSQKCNGEHRYTPDNENDERHRQILANSLTYDNAQYFVGLPCRCCVGDEKCDLLRQQSEQKDDRLTWANLFVNANYLIFLRDTIPIIGSRTINIVCHQKAQVEQLPFETHKVFRIGANAWVDDYENTLKDMQTYLEDNQIRNEVFVFCAGVLSNMLIYQLTRMNSNNTYIDLGSVFDVTMGLSKTRQYLKGKKKRLKKVCIW